MALVEATVMASAVTGDPATGTVTAIPPGKAGMRLTILPPRDPCVPDDAVDVFTQETPDQSRTIKVRYESDQGAYVRCYDIEQLSIWLERQPDARDPIFSGLHFSPQQRKEIMQRAAAAYCSRLGKDQMQDGSLYLAMRMFTDDCLHNLLESLPMTFWSQDKLWTLMQEAAQRRRTAALLFLFDEGVRQRHFNISSLTTLLLLAFQNGWPTKEVMRIILSRLPSQQVHRKAGWPWSPALLVALSTAVHMCRYRDTARILRRLACFIQPEHLRTFYAANRAHICSDAVLKAMFQDREIGFPRLMIRRV